MIGTQHCCSIDTCKLIYIPCVKQYSYMCCQESFTFLCFEVCGLFQAITYTPVGWHGHLSKGKAFSGWLAASPKWAVSLASGGQGEWRWFSCRKEPVNLKISTLLLALTEVEKTLITRGKPLLHIPQCLLIYTGAFSHVFHNGTGAPCLWRQAGKVGTVHQKKRRSCGDLIATLQYLKGACRDDRKGLCQEL